MANQLEAVAAVAIERNKILSVLVALAVIVGSGALSGGSTIAGAQDAPPSAESAAEESDDSPSLEWMSFRFSTYLQRGRGYQSQDRTIGTGPGGESVQIYQPIAMARIRQSRSIVHTIVVPIDIVSAASADALDMIGHASRENEAGSLDITTTLNADRDLRYILHYGFHIEEPFKAIYAGFGVAHDFAEHNATLAASAEVNYDGFDDLQYYGDDNGWKSRVTSSLNVSLSQVLSPTTLASISYGVTLQAGTLETTYNSLPISTGGRMSERFPSDRLRQALTFRIAQLIRPTRTTLRASYRLYGDTFGLLAHTADVQLYQYLTSTFMLRGSYRFHRQNGVNFFHTGVAVDFPLDQPRTGDSDLAEFTAHEVGGGFRIYLTDERPVTESSRYIDAMYYRYSRSNGLKVDMATIGYGQMF